MRHGRSPVPVADCYEQAEENMNTDIATGYAYMHRPDTIGWWYLSRFSDEETAAVNIQTGWKGRNGISTLYI